MSDFNDFGFSTVSADDYAAQQTKTVEVNSEEFSENFGSIVPKMDMNSEDGPM